MIVRPVIDVKGGVAVRAVAGARTNYRPRRTPFAADADPLALARGLRDALDTPAVYLADLDALDAGFVRGDRRLWETLAGDGFDLLLDPGVRTPGDIDSLLTLPDSRIVVATESAGSQAGVAAALAAGRGRGVLGLDLRAGAAVGPAVAGFAGSPAELADELTAAAPDAPVLVLDVAAVGTGRGVPTLGLCADLRRRRPTRPVLTGGGVRNLADVRAAAAAGVSELLVASALDDGRLSVDDLRPYLPRS